MTCKFKRPELWPIPTWPHPPIYQHQTQRSYHHGVFTFNGAMSSCKTIRTPGPWRKGEGLTLKKGTQLCRSVSRRITCSIIFTEVPAGQIRLQYTRLLAMLVFPCRLRTKCPACALGYRHHRDICGFLSATYLSVPRRTQAAKDRALVALI